MVIARRSRNWRDCGLRDLEIKIGSWGGRAMARTEPIRGQTRAGFTTAFATQSDRLLTARRTVVESLVFARSYLDASELREDLTTKKLVWGATGLSVDFRGTMSSFQDGMRGLPDDAKVLERAGVSRMGTWISPGHNSLTYLSNFKQHTSRLREIGKALREHGVRLGLEYVGPKTSWSATRYPFIHTCVTGVIDLKSFLGALVKIGYDGPVRAEPFKVDLRRLPAEEAVDRTAKAMKRAVELIG
jgi:hypothetical protein